MPNAGPHRDRGAVLVAALAAVCLLPATALMAFASLPPITASVVTALAAAAHTAVLWRRAAPTATLLAVALLLAGVAVGTGLFVLLPSTLLLLIALHSAAAYGDIRVAAGVAVVAPLAAAARYGTDASVVASDFGPAPWLLGILMLALCAVAVMMGLLRRSELRRASLVSAQLELERQGRADREAHAVATERARISRDLHDVLAHSLTVIVGQARVARFAPADADAAVQAIESTARDSLRDLRQALRTLQADDGDRHPVPGLADLPELAERMRTLGLTVNRRSTGTAQPLGAAAELALHRVVQEGLTNALRHGTGPLEWDERWEEDRLVIELRNAVPPVPRRSEGAGLGLRGMQERLASVGGAIEVCHETPEFTLRVTMPLAPAGASIEGGSA